MTALDFSTSFYLMHKQLNFQKSYNIKIYIYLIIQNDVYCDFIHFAQSRIALCTAIKVSPHSVGV